MESVHKMPKLLSNHVQVQDIKSTRALVAHAIDNINVQPEHDSQVTQHAGHVPSIY